MAVTRHAFLAACAAVAAAGGAGRADAQTLIPVQVGYFPGISALPLLTGVYLGMFAAEGLAIDAEPAIDTVNLFRRLDEGIIDVAHTPIDAAIAYDVGVGSQAVQNRDFVAILGVDDGQFRLVGRRGVKRITQLRGKTLAVDALGSGLAFVLRGMLAVEGVAEDEYRLVGIGDAQQRANALAAGKLDGTLLTPPYDLSVRARGCLTLARATDLLGGYQGISAVVRRAWLENNASAALRYKHAYREALAHAAGDKAGSIPLLVGALHVSPAVAAASYDAALRHSDGFCNDGRLDLGGIRTVLRLRARYAPPGGGDDPAPYIESAISAPQSA
ncbi:MAG TPA: ABC transporter substrate-binding protein [Candidatus Elarobacter sp.]|jgi:ABC-type nitrate/sulfonate/bicarbonate transport system substrate-binding protein|nr:ABC transporter substrate-binding protein [Candidatus Elarobacter sp.]